MDILGSHGCKAYEVKWTHACLTLLMMVMRSILDHVGQDFGVTTDKNLLATIP
jgi:hypothetical protein